MAAKKKGKNTKPWARSMPESQFELMKQILAAPSPVGLEAAMTHGVIADHLKTFLPKSWKVHGFKGSAGILIDSAPDNEEAFSVMVIGHADKIRMQVRSISEDGKIWLDTDSFLPSTLIGHETILFSEDPKNPGEWRSHTGGTVEALGAIHFASNEVRSGSSGITKEMIYLEMQLHGEKRKERLEKMGIRPGDPVILNRPIRRGFDKDSFYGAYLDNGLGCFHTIEVAKLLAKSGLKNVRFLGAIASWEEIGRFGSRVLVGEFKPDVVIGVDVNHDYVAAPGIAARRLPSLTMGKGFTLSAGAIASAPLNTMIQKTALKHDIPMQMDVVGRDTGTDAMAGVLANVDAAATSIGFPIRNMHTISETGHTGDVIAAIHVVSELIKDMDGMNRGKGIKSKDLIDQHPRLDKATKL